MNFEMRNTIKRIVKRQTKRKQQIKFKKKVDLEKELSKKIKQLIQANNSIETKFKILLFKKVIKLIIDNTK